MRYYSLINSMSRGNQGTNFLTDLVAYYSFDSSNATDIHTGTHNGTVVGSPTFPSGINSNCIDFGNNGNLYYVDVADSADFSFTNGTNDLSFSISMWVNFSAISGFGNWLINKRNATSGGDEWQFVYYSGLLRFVKFDKTSNTIIQEASFSFTPTTNVWYHMIYSEDGSQTFAGMKIYLNGVSQTLTNSSSGGTYTGMNNGSSIVRMGMSAWAAADALKHRGKLDEIAIWKNRELTSTEVTELYNAGAGKFYNTF